MSIYNHFMNQAGLLYRLQRTDTQLDQIAQRLGEIQRLLAGDKRLQAATQAVEAARVRLEKARNDLRSAEHRVNEQRTRIEQSNATLYSGLIKNPKELEDLQKEIASLNRYLVTLEDNQLQVMIDLENAEDAHTRAEANLEGVEGEVITSQAGLAGERDQLTSRRQSLSVEREAALGSVSAESLQIYQRLRSSRRGVAVTTVEDNTCALCGAPIRPAEVQAARNPSALAYCSSCGRIIFAG